MSSWFKLFKLRLGALFRRGRRENSLDREMQLHLDQLTEEYRQEGMSETEARQAAQREFGNVGSYKEECRDSWGIRLMHNLVQDLSFACRQMKHAPGFVAVVVLTLALGIGSVTTIFSLAYGLLIKPLPYPHPEELVMVLEGQVAKGANGYVAPATYLHWRDQATDFEAMSLRGSFSGNVFAPGVSFHTYAQASTPNYFSLFGVQPMLGRDFRPDEATPGKSNVMILSHRIWRGAFAENPEVIGMSVLLDKVPFTIIGVMPKSFQLDPRIDLYTPITLTAQSSSDYQRRYVGIGRLKPGVSLKQADAQLDSLSGQLAQAYPEFYEGYGASVGAISDIETEDGKVILPLLLGAVGCLLLVACTNIANLLLARSGARQAEIAVRAALGAGRWRIFRQLLVESLLLAGIGGVLGIALAYGGMTILLSVLPSFIHHLDQIKLDGGVIVFTCVLTVCTGLVCGLMPALRASRVDLNTALKDGGRRGTTGSKGSHRLRSSLVVAQIALALVLLSGAGLFVRSLLKAQHSDFGFETETTYLNPILFAESKYPTVESRLNLVNRLLESINQVHGIEAATFTNQTSPWSGGPRASYSIVGRKDDAPEQRPSVVYYGVTRDYFTTLQIPLIRGRLFNDRDKLGAPRVALINETMARTVFAGNDPIGQLIVLHDDQTEVPREVVGVVGNTLVSLKQELLPQIYEPYEQLPGISTVLIVRTDGTPIDLKALDAAVHAVDPDVPTLGLLNLSERMDSSLSLYRIIVSLFGTFGLIALLLASLGIYGVMAYSVAQRTGEIGIRMALGARNADIWKLVFRQSGRLLLIGLIIGLAGAFGLAQLLRSQLVNISPSDPLTFLLITLVFAAVAFLACFLPARRATEIDPMVALRAE
jgi:putative ABC transport system permease protein